MSFYTQKIDKKLAHLILIGLKYFEGGTTI